MKTRLFAFAFGLALACTPAMADGILKHHQRTPPVCEPGYKIVEEIVMQEVTRHVCKTVPEFKKKWVYSFIDDPFCIRDSKHGGCPNCAGPYCRKQLVKREVLEPCPTTKCVVETVTELVPVKVYHKVPCPAALDVERLPSVNQGKR